MTRPVPGQLALDLGVDPLPAVARRCAPRRLFDHPALDLGPLVRRPRPPRGPVWPRFLAVREDGGAQ